jgi:hypothetical protein
VHFNDLEHALRLIQVQNDTIACLRKQVDCMQLQLHCYPVSFIQAGSAPTDDSMYQRLESLEANLEKLAEGLGHAVQASVVKRSLPLEQRIAQLESNNSGRDDVLDNVMSEDRSDAFSLAAKARAMALVAPR